MATILGLNLIRQVYNLKVATRTKGHMMLDLQSELDTKVIRSADEEEGEEDDLESDDDDDDEDLLDDAIEEDEVTE